MGCYHVMAAVALMFGAAKIYAVPTETTASFIVTSTTEPNNEAAIQKEATFTDIPLKIPKIYQMHVRSQINNRYANTTIISKVRNTANKAQEATFSVVLPETAFISGFVMEIAGKNYTAYVKEKEEAKKTYDEAVGRGLGAAHVAVSARDSNRFTVSCNIEPEAKAAFYLNYEQLLKREEGRYELILNLHPGQPVKDLSVEVIISESRKITLLKAPPLRSGNEIGNDNEELDPRADLEIVNNTQAVVRFAPNLERQKQIAHLFGSNENDGLAGQFIVQYDVERDPQGGEVLLQDGYFVHFFAPSNIKPLPKHVVFVLDTSYSMVGIRISQLREAMDKILGELKESDIFNIVEFSTNVKVWDLNDHNASVWYPTNEDTWRDEASDKDINKFEFPNAYSASADNIKKAKATVAQLEPNGGTDIFTGLTVGLYLVELAKRSNQTNAPQPMIVFLTDGEPTNGVTEISDIIKNITKYNSGVRHSPIYTLSFGDDADKSFLQKISLLNSGFSRHIYEAADASLQLQEFYQQISSPLLANVSFKYGPTATSLTQTDFPLHFGGSEIVVSGWCGTYDLNAKVTGWDLNGATYFQPKYNRPVTSVERLWAYLTVKQLLQKKESSEKDEKEIKNKVLNLALKYSFVTAVSSLVVVKPNETDSVDTETANKERRLLPHASGFGKHIYRHYNVILSHVDLGAAPRAGIPLSGFIALKSASVDIRSSADEQFDGAFEYEDDGLTTTTETKSLNASKVVDILKLLPWLQDILNENGTVNLPSGEFSLGLDIELDDHVDCPVSPLNGTGRCTLLNACAHPDTLFTTIELFVQHVCILQDTYAGVCCPIENSKNRK